MKALRLCRIYGVTTTEHNAAQTADKTEVKKYVKFHENHNKTNEKSRGVT